MAQLIKGKQIASQSVTISGSTGNVVVVGDLNVGNYQVNVTNFPTSSTHLANKAYVDAIAQGVTPHAPVIVVSTNNITASGLALTIDGVLMSTEGERVLIAGQTDKTQNGIFVVSASTWQRAEDANGDPDNEVSLGDFVFVISGTTNGSTGWVLGKTDSPDLPITPGVDTQEWYKMAAPGTYSADGEGLELNGTVFSLELDGTSLSKSGTGVKVSSGYTTSVETLISSSVSSEASTRTSSDASLATSLSTETSTRTSADASLNTSLSTEVSTRTSADSSLNTSLSTETSTRESVDESLATSLSTEVSVRTSADSSLASAIGTLASEAVSTEASIRQSVDESIATSLSTEVSTRTSADSSLNTSLSTETSTRESVDSSLATSLSTETSTRESVDSSLSTSISTEVSTRTSADSSLASAIGTLASEAVSTEASIRQSVDESLATGLSTEVSTRESVDSSLATGLSTEVSTRTSADSSLNTSLSTEVSVRTSADASLASAIDGINSPSLYNEEITPANSGSTNNVVVSTTAFVFTTGTIQLNSIFVHLNGIQYQYGTSQGSGNVFYTVGTPTSGSGVTLYFDGTVADFAIETNDAVNIKFTTIV